MKATIIVGSARVNGNTETQCSSLADALAENGFDVEIIKPAKLDILHCNGCNKCMDNEGCVLDDDMQIIYEAFEESDLFVLATPVYFSGPSSILKQVIDRFQCKWQPIDEPKTDKWVALLANGGSRNPRFENIISICRAFAISVRSNWAGECLFDNCDDDDTSELSSEAYRFGEQLSKMLRD